MALDTYAALQASILSWLGRPADPLVSPSIPDIIQLFEHEADRRLKVAGAEKRVSLTAISAAVALPADFGQLRLATSGGVILTYVTPMQLPDGGGPPSHYTIIGNEMRLGPSPSATCTIEIVYQSGVPPLSDTNTSNWLLTQHPDCYLFGSLVEAESFIGSDERIPLWAQRREAAFASIETADRKARWGGAPLSIRAEGVSGGNGTAAGDWTSAPPLAIPTLSAGTGITLTPSPIVASGSVALTVPVAVTSGGTNKTSWATGSVVFAASTGALGEDNAGLFWDDTNNRLGVGTAAPGSRLQLHGATANPPTTGTTRTGIEYLTNSTDTGAASIGMRAGGAGFWLQSHDATDQSVKYPLLLNPSGGNVGVGTNAPTVKFTVAGQAAAGGIVSSVWSGPVGSDTSTFMLTFYDFAGGTLSGAISRNGTNTVAYGTSSDERLKENISDSRIGLEELMSIRVCDYEWKEGGGQQHGLIAQQVGGIYPAAVIEGGGDPQLTPWMIDYGRLTPLLIKSVQQQQAVIEALRARLEALEGKPAAPVLRSAEREAG